MKRTCTTRPSSGASRRIAALMDLLELSGRPRSKIGWIVNFHIVLCLDTRQPCLELFLPQGLGDLTKDIVERLLADFLGAEQIKTIGLLDRSAQFALLQSKYGGFNRLRI